MGLDIVKIIFPIAFTFLIGIALTPLITHYLYRYKAWKKEGGKVALDGTTATVFNQLHQENERKTPRMGGLVIWVSVFIAVVTIWVLGRMFPEMIFAKLDFLSRNQTWIPFFALISGALTGLFSDILDITKTGKKTDLPLRIRLLIVAVLSLFIGTWFFFKLDITAVGVPFGGDIEIGWLLIPFFMLVTLALYASGVIDGIDGLSGGVFASIFAAYAIIAFSQNQIDLAAFCAALVGGILAFLWFNIPPARFWMTETGTMGLTVTLAVVAFMTDSLGEGEGVLLLPIIGFLLVVTVSSNIIQIVSKKFRHKKVFRVAPLHHHFEALGWPGYKVTMRYWVLSVIFAFTGVLIALLG